MGRTQGITTSNKVTFYRKKMETDQESTNSKRVREDADAEMDLVDVRSLVEPILLKYTQERPLHRVNMVVLSDTSMFFVPRVGEWYWIEAASVPGVGTDQQRMRALFGAFKKLVVDQNLPFFEFNGSVLARMDFDAKPRLFVSEIDGCFVNVSVYDFPALQLEFETPTEAQTYHAKNNEFRDLVFREMDERRAAIDELNRLWDEECL